MFHEFRDTITHMKQNSTLHDHFLRIFDRHNELENKIDQAQIGGILTDLELESLKKEKLLLKDKAYALLLRYKKEHQI